MSPSFQKILEILHQNKVEFAVVGGVAAVLHGAPVTTFDLDVLIKIDEANADHLLAAFEQLGARYRGHKPDLHPTRADILAGGHMLLMTDAGPLDVLGFIGSKQRFVDLMKKFETMRIGSLEIRVLGIEELIHQKRIMGRDKDIPAIRMLELAKKQKKT